MNIIDSMIPTIWYENEDGDKWIPDLRMAPNYNVPDGFNYMHSQIPTYLLENIYKLGGNDIGTRYGQIGSTWSEDLVLVMANSGHWTLSQSILIAANSCSRCMNSLAHKYGLKWGYPEYGSEWKQANVSCMFCNSELEIKQLSES